MQTILLQSEINYFLANIFDAIPFKLLGFILLLGIIGIIIRLIRESQPEQILPNQKNKIINVDFTGGIIGLFFSSPRRKLNKIIAKENQEGWKVVEVLDSEKGNFFTALVQVFLLIITLFLYTTVSGKYIVFEKDNNMLF